MIELKRLEAEGKYQRKATEIKEKREEVIVENV